ncbi:MAG: peptidase [Actinomycetia bacterium]|nr:peptidase [Actinomycetes bacterium]
MYTSMVALVVVLFFSVTGITLNHPQWTFGDDTDRTEETGTLPFSALDETGSPSYLPIAEYARNEFGFSGAVDSFGEVAGEISIVFKKPGYAAEIAIDAETGEFRTIVEQQGWVAVLNDLHKGRDSGSSWSWVIDVSAGLLVVISVTGLTMQLYLRKRRKSALWTVAGGTLLTVVLVWITLA